MKEFFKKPLGAVVAATMAMGVATTAHASTDAGALGDMAIVPYYTVMDDYVTGVHIINTSELTQVVKMRLRRDSDSADVLDFNIIMSPLDEWTGFITDAGGTLRVGTNDTTCTVPENSGSIPAPAINREGAEEGYVEIIAMGAAATGEPISRAAVHVNGVPSSCVIAASNFFKSNVLANDKTESMSGDARDGRYGETDYTDTADNTLKVSYFIRDAATGLEFGDNAQHINTGFIPNTNPATMVATPFTTDTYGPSITNQETGLNSGDRAGFDFPDLDGGGLNVDLDDTTTNTTATRGMYNSVIRKDLAVAALINDWAYDTTSGVMTDWVITVPGQYLMVDPNPLPVTAPQVAPNHQDLPLTARVVLTDREEGPQIRGGLVVSPSPSPDAITLSEEVNVVEWGGQSIFNTANPVEIMPNMASGATKGWGALTISSSATDDRRVFDLTDAKAGGGPVAAGELNGGTAARYNAPILGFAAWKRNVGDPNKNYGRIIAHSRRK